MDMRKGITALVAVLAVFGVLVLILLIGVAWYFGTYNSLISQRVAVDASWSEVQNHPSSSGGSFGGGKSGGGGGGTHW